MPHPLFGPLSSCSRSKLAAEKDPSIAKHEDVLKAEEVSVPIRLPLRHLSQTCMSHQISPESCFLLPSALVALDLWLLSVV